MSTLLIANPTAGRGRVRRQMDAVRQSFAAAGQSCDIVYTDAAGHAVELARAAAAKGYRLVVAVGGDGTMGEVLNGIAGTGAALGLLPLGTGNDLARTLGIPLNMRGAVDVLLAPAFRRIDIGKEREGQFAIITGINFPAEAMAQVNRQKGPFRGSAAIFAGTVSVVSRLRAVPMRVELDDKVIEGRFTGVFVLNTKFTGGGLLLAPDALPDDGWLDIVLMGELSRLDFLWTLPKAYKGGHLKHPAVSIYRAKRVAVTADQPLPKLFDGNTFGSSPLEATIAPLALEVAVPRQGGASA